jgi:hypothetical protein
MPVLALLAIVLTAQPNLAKLALKPTQVGPGYVTQVRPDGLGTAQRTLDLCGTTGYPSEALRVDRLQVNYGRVNAKLALSNEVVRYKPGGAAQAMREVVEHAASCPKKAIAFEGFPPLHYDITRITDSKLLKGYVAARVHRHGTVKGKSVDDTFFVVYQRRGNILSGVYSYAAKGVTASEQQAFVLHAAEQSARTLRAGGTPSGGVPA